MKEPSNQSVRLAGSTIQPPCHACAFFHSERDEDNVLLPFIKEGFERGDKSFHIIDERRRQAYMNRLAMIGIDASAEVTGQLEIRGWENAHLRPGWFDQHAMLALVEEVLTEAEQKGYAHTRWIANMGWALEDKPGVKYLVEYCARLNQVVPKYRATVLCVYDLARFSAAQVVDVLRSHPMAIIGGTVQHNPFFVPPDQLIRELEEPKYHAPLS
jgi:KaiC/GvpD/RAD55 family RecA-like ATPase